MTRPNAALAAFAARAIARPAQPAQPLKPAAGSLAATAVSLCVAIQRAQTTVERGQPAWWVISAWTTGGNVPNATVRLVSAPVNLPPQFGFGCGSHDGTPSCGLGEIAAQSAPRQLEARILVPATATSVATVKLTVIASAANLPTDPQATAGIPVTAAPAAGSGTGTGGVPAPPVPVSVGNLPFLNGSSGTTGTLSPGGNAAGLFPALTPSSDTPQGTQPQQKTNARTVANTSALPLGAPVVGAQLIGLGVLALAFVLTVTRMSIRRRPVPSRPAPAQAGTLSSAGKDTPEG